MIIVTGGAGFIGSNLVKGLNQNGLDEILVVDDLKSGNKFTNLQGSRVADYIDKQDFLDALNNRSSYRKIDAVFHQGACSNTMENDGRYMMSNNYTYSKKLFEYCIELSVPFIYASSASVYGSNTVFVEAQEYEKALNVYAFSKLLFDQYVRRRIVSVQSQVVGLRYFNVYGPGEDHKGRMASIAHHMHNQFVSHGYVALFKGSHGYKDGEQMRDFVWVGDVVDVNLFFLQHPDVSGIFNLGTGKSETFNAMATAMINSLNGTHKTTKQLVESGIIRYIDFPETLIDKYQSFTQADISSLVSIGYTSSFKSVTDGACLFAENLKAM